MKPGVLLIFSLMIMCMETSCAQNRQGSIKEDAFPELVKNRRSIRRYTDQAIDRETISRILEAALFAPSSYGQNPVEFVVVEDKKVLSALAAAKRIGAPSVRAASAAVVVIADKEKGELWIEDTSVAAAYVLLAAEHYGIGACWNQIRDRQGQRASAEEEIRQLLDIPSRYAVLCVIAMGYKGEQKVPHTEEELDFGRIHFSGF